MVPFHDPVSKDLVFDAFFTSEGKSFVIFAGWFGIRLLPVVTRGAREAAEAPADQADAAGTARREGHRTGRDRPDNEVLL
jgi:hypothetical protein